jgi:hypothetical protein
MILKAFLLWLLIAMKTDLLFGKISLAILKRLEASYITLSLIPCYCGVTSVSLIAELSWNASRYLLYAAKKNRARLAKKNEPSFAESMEAIVNLKAGF